MYTISIQYACSSFTHSLTRSTTVAHSQTDQRIYIPKSFLLYLYLSTYLLYVPAYLLIIPLTNFSLIHSPIPSLHSFLPSFIPSLLYLFVGLLMDSFGTLGCRSTMEKVQLNWLPICVWELHTFLCFFGRMPQCHKGSTRETLEAMSESPKAFVERASFSKNPWGQRVKREGKWRLRMMSLIWRNLSSEDCSCGHINFYPWWIDLCFFATVITVDVFPLHV